MDPVGASASVLTLTATVVSIGKIVVDLAQSLQSAPVELNNVVLQLDTIREHLNCLSRVEKESSLDGLCEQYQRIVKVALDQSQYALLKMANALPPIEKRSDVQFRVRWVVCNRAQVKRLSQGLEQAQQNLRLAIQILDLRNTVLMRKSVVNLTDLQTHVVSQTNYIRSILEEENSNLCSCNWVKLRRRLITRGDRPQPLPMLTAHAPIRLSKWAWLSASGVSGTIASSSNKDQTSYRASVGFRLPLIAYAISLELFVHLSRLHKSSLHWNPGFIVVKNIVPDDALIMTACERADLPVVQSLLENRGASLNDMTEKGRTPLMFAVKSRDCAMVKLLIDSGVDINASCGPFQESPLQLAAQVGSLDMCRLLLDNGASGSHTDAQGWTVAFHLWSKINVRMPDQTAFLNLLTMNNDCELDVIGCYNWTALHRAAAFGTPADVSTLMQRGAEASICTEGLEWSPLHYAAFFGNDEVLCEMAKPQYHINIDHSDVRGWSPLHVAVREERWDTVVTLLKLGANSTARTMPTTFHVTAEMRSRSVTPGEIAKERGPTAWRAYLDALQQSQSELDKDQTEEIFWDVAEQM